MEVRRSYTVTTNFTILDGPTGKTVYSYPMLSVTGTEYPVVVDINHDGSAEILIEGELHLLIQPMSSASNPPTSWAPARSVWNQAGYHITNVNDDLTIPASHKTTRHFWYRWLCPDHLPPALQHLYVPGNLSHPGWLCQMAGGETSVWMPCRTDVNQTPSTSPWWCNQSDNALKRDSVLLGIYEQGRQSASVEPPNPLPQNGIGHIVNVDTITLAICQWQTGSRRAELPHQHGIPTTFSQNIKGLTAVLGVII